LTFIHGPRSCIGQSFAKNELKALVAAWVLAFQFEMKDPLEEVVPFGMVTMKPKNGLYLRVTSLEE
jgi:cytochrome P450